ncbi:MAG: zinc metallopeptidase [Parasporobacterium sp.]|nr:zinc metallopeptidase [Parasporobacterium sp.]
MFLDWSYILVLIGVVITIAAQVNVSGAFNRYSKVLSSRGLTAESAAMMILQNAGINDVRIERIGGKLTDHYSPGEKVLRLSESVYGKTSVAAIGVAAHECGHAIQHQVGYGPLKLRSASVPMARIGSYISWPLILIGLIFGVSSIADIGVILFAFVVIFQLITLPVEFNASTRALKILEGSSILPGSELEGAAKVLKAAALTYVAALLTSVLQLLRLISIVSRRN